LALLTAGVVLAASASAAPLHPNAVNLIENGSFETGSFASWTGNPPDSVVLNQFYDGFSAESGSDYALLGPRGGDGTLAQSFTDHGGELTISFWLASDGGLPNDFSVSFDGRTLLRLSDIALQGWTLYTETVAATGNDTLQFSFRNDPGYLALDNISVSETSVPEPASVAVLAVGLALAVAGRRARKFAA
jgi:hypothetical protein